MPIYIPRSCCVILYYKIIFSINYQRGRTDASDIKNLKMSSIKLVFVYDITPLK